MVELLFGSNLQKWSYSQSQGIDIDIDTAYCREQRQHLTARRGRNSLRNLSASSASSLFFSSVCSVWCWTGRQLHLPKDGLWGLSQLLRVSCHELYSIFEPLGTQDLRKKCPKNGWEKKTSWSKSVENPQKPWSCVANHNFIGGISTWGWWTFWGFKPHGVVRFFPTSVDYTSDR